ncbi:hydrogenase maturation protease [Thalassovita mangrovi]|uniref:Hydrogenase maturation protease n=1 Tax=Thalassovita mangrovi TaxID=2692236 RepID=A0A6L8LMG3_9RHOB|nr:hydrogenase maturation protease [Thalassovita mangrovi]MYM57214.1 hydrogenase maturation protease [Thalassovita mangrovi]
MLLIGYGNPGRGDDGLGPAFAERIERAGLPGVTVMVDYQLTVEHAFDVAGAGQVVFADALIGGAGAFRFTEAAPATDADITSHSLSPEAVLTLARTLYDAAPEAHVMGITGQDFGEVREGLSDPAQGNLDRAVEFFLDWAKDRR